MTFKKNSFFKKIFEEFKNTKKIPLIDLHVHTNWTDGTNTVEEMASAACKKKISTILFSEHSRRTSGNWFSKFTNDIKKTQKKIENKCKLLVGTEVKVLNFKGTLDINPKIKKKCDLIMASVHRFPGEEGNIMKNTNDIKKNDAVEIEYDLLVAAINNSDADIIGHPFGMSIKRFKIYPRWKLFKEIIKKCQKREKIFEVNFHYHNNYRQLLNECLNSKTLFSLGSNAHNKNELGKITKI